MDIRAALTPTLAAAALLGSAAAPAQSAASPSGTADNPYLIYAVPAPPTPALPDLLKPLAPPPAAAPAATPSAPATSARPAPAIVPPQPPPAPPAAFNLWPPALPNLFPPAQQTTPPAPAPLPPPQAKPAQGKTLSDLGQSLRNYFTEEELELIFAYMQESVVAAFKGEEVLLPADLAFKLEVLLIRLQKEGGQYMDNLMQQLERDLKRSLDKLAPKDKKPEPAKPAPAQPAAARLF